MQIVVGGQPLILNHFPLLVYGGRHTKTWQLFGHIHTTTDGSEIIPDSRMQMLAPTQYDVGVDNNGFAPVPFEKLRKIIVWQQETGLRFSATKAIL